jgi:hypothetical protein
MPAAATRLLATVLKALQVDAITGFLIWTEGRFQAKPDRDNVLLIPPSSAQRVGFRMGVALGRLLRAVQLSRSWTQGAA